ncbi:MAG: hypothetical protein M3530_01530, partial [Thermoproteota archaeon]|nr:hypothetical protein [Thermoproteota archaeon]
IKAFRFHSNSLFSHKSKINDRVFSDRLYYVLLSGYFQVFVYTLELSPLPRRDHSHAKYTEDIL